MVDDVGELFDELVWIVKIQIDGPVDGDSETTTDAEQIWISGKSLKR